MFRSARLKLTGWYLLMIMLISLFFSIVIYANVDRELVRLESVQEVSRSKAEEYFGYAPPFGVTDVIGENLIDEARGRLITDLAILNTCILIAAGFAGYFLAGRTLTPIKVMLDTQSRFLTDASHELKTPLTSLRTETEIYLRSKKHSLIASDQILRSNLEEIIRLQKLTNNLMELSTLEKAGERIPFEKVNLELLINNAIEKVSKLALDKKVEISKKTRKTMVSGNSLSLEELVTILLDNSIKYSFANSKVTISCGYKNNLAYIKVEDHGIGISEKDLEHVFDRFFRADKSRNAAKIPGYGLGLSIAKEIVSLHRGSIYAKSSKKSTVFTVELPRA